MPDFQHNEIHRSSSEKGKGFIGSLLVHLSVFAVLVLVSFSVPPPPVAEEGIMVNFGTDETGFGEIEPSPPAYQEETAPPTGVTETAKQKEVLAASPKPKENPVITQDNEETPAVKKVDPEAEKRKIELAENERIRKEAIVAERKKKEQEETERKRIEAEQQRQTDIMNRTKNALAGSMNTGTSSTSEGIAGGTGNQGDPNGSVNSKNRGDGGGTGNSGISYSLEGRGALNIPLPNYVYQEDGKVVVEVTVNRQGKVIQAEAGKKGSTTFNDNLIRAAKDAAMKATFEVKADAPAVQKGTITYNFVLK